jgi:chemotaxis protein MotA
MFSLMLGLTGFGFSLWYVLTASAARSFSGYIDYSALVLLLVAPPSIIFISHNFIDFFKGISVLFSMATLNQNREMNQLSNQLTQLSSSVRTDGIGVIAQFKGRVKNTFFRDGLQLILSGFTPEEIKHNLVAKINAKQNQFVHAQNLFESLAKLCPGMGLLGTIIGLVQMLSNLDDPKKIGPGLAVALLSTLYGLVLGSAVYGPIAEKISIYAEKMKQIDIMILEGVLLLKHKKSNAHLRDVLNTYSKGPQQRSGGGQPTRENQAG